MVTTAVLPTDRTLAEVLHDLGDISPDRIRFPAGNATEKDVVHHLDGANKRIYELIDGILVEKAMGLQEAILACYFGRVIGNFVDEQDLGVCFAPDGPVRIRPGRIRFPDTGFIPWSRIPGGVIPEKPITDIVPTLSIEVISDGNTPREMENKLVDYFDAGVKLVWYVYPKLKSAIAYTSPTRKKMLGIHDSLDGGKILPGLSIPLRSVFGQLGRRKK